MNKKGLISLLIAGSITVAGASTLYSCSDVNTLAPDCDERKNFTIEMSLDANQQFFNVSSFDVELNNGKYYIKFLGHYDEGATPIHHRYARDQYKYTEHKDYLVTYGITKEEYKNIMMFYNNTMNEIKFLTLENLASLQAIVDCYDPISVEETSIEDIYGEHLH